MSNGADMLEMVCNSYESPPEGERRRASGKGGADDDDEGDEEEPEQFDFSAFRCAALRHGGTLVSVATFRVFGTRLAEVPFVGELSPVGGVAAGGQGKAWDTLPSHSLPCWPSLLPLTAPSLHPPPKKHTPQHTATKDGYRRAGHCRRLVGALEDLLASHRVRYLVLPSVKPLLPMWRGSFGFVPFTVGEQQALECHIVTPDFDSAVLVKKQIWPPMAPAAAARGGSMGASGGGRAARASKLLAAKRLAEGARRDERRARKRPRRGGGRARGRGRRGRGSDSDSEMDESSSSGGDSDASSDEHDDGRDADFDAAASSAAAGGSGADGSSESDDDFEDEGSDGVVAPGHRRRRCRSGGGSDSGARRARAPPPGAAPAASASLQGAAGATASEGGATAGGGGGEDGAAGGSGEDGGGGPSGAAGAGPSSSAPPSYVEVLDSFTSLAPVLDFAVQDLDRAGQGQLVMCCGTLRDGSLRVVRNGVGLSELSTVELAGVRGAWSLRPGWRDAYDRLLVLAFVGETRVREWGGRGVSSAGKRWG